MLSVIPCEFGHPHVLWISRFSIHLLQFNWHQNLKVRYGFCFANDILVDLWSFEFFIYKILEYKEIPNVKKKEQMKIPVN